VPQDNPALSSQVIKVFDYQYPFSHKKEWSEVHWLWSEVIHCKAAFRGVTIS